MEETKHDSVLDARESVELDKDLEEFLKEVDWASEAIEDNIFDPTEEDIPVSYVLEYNGIPFAPLGGLCGLNGQPGHGKTMTFSMLLAAILRGQYGAFKCLLDNETTSCLYIDTEMEKVNTQRVVRRVYNMVGWQQRTDQPRLHTLWLREVNDATQRWRKILKAIWQYKPTVVLIDGLIDVVKDFNDNKECQDRIYQCMSVASHYNINVWCLLHLNPGSDKAVGHLGSFLERKATDIFITSLDDEASLFKIKHKKHRLIKIRDIQFHVDDDEHHYGHPVLEDGSATETATTESKEPSDTEVFNAIKVIGTDSCSFTALRERIRKAQSIGSGKAGEFINLGVKLNYLLCNDNQYTITNPEWLNEESDEIPF